MSGPAAPAAGADIDAGRLEAWMAANVGSFKGPLRVEKFSGGQSNPTYKLNSPGGAYVLRRKPSGVLLKSAHAIDREYKVMAALAGSAVPVPKMLGYCSDAGVIGTEFFVMAYLEGRIFWNPALPELSMADRETVYKEMVEKLAALHMVDFAKAGLSDFGRPGDYFGRQLKRWSEQYRASETGAIEAMDRLMAWLQQNLPPDDGRVALVHGDYRIDNMIFDAAAPRMIALLDWELSTLGHPFADIAYQCMQWRLPNDGQMRGLGGIDRAVLGIPTEEAYVKRYCDLMGLTEIPNWSFYLAFCFFRLAAILQGVKKRALDGNGSNPEAGIRMGAAIPVLAGLANDIIDKGARP